MTTREQRLEKSLRAMVLAARKAVIAQQRYGSWMRFMDYYSPRGKVAATVAARRCEKAIIALAQAESLADEALRMKKGARR